MLIQVSSRNQGIFLLRIFAILILVFLLTGEGWVLYSRLKEANTVSAQLEKLYTPTIDNQGLGEALKRLNR